MQLGSQRRCVVGAATGGCVGAAGKATSERCTSPGILHKNLGRTPRGLRPLVAGRAQEGQKLKVDGVATNRTPAQPWVNEWARRGSFPLPSLFLTVSYFHPARLARLDASMV